MNYEIIYADPAWSYRDKNTNGKRGSSFKYPVLTKSQIMALPVRDIAAESSALFLWITPPLLKDAFAVMGAWGYEYKTFGFVWVKMNKKADTPFMGLGHYTRANAEPCLLGTRGKISRINSGVQQLIMQDEPEVIYSRIREHSRKPDETRDRIVQLLGDVPRIELFARHRFEGWDAWGNQVESDIQLI